MELNTNIYLFNYYHDIYLKLKLETPTYEVPIGIGT